MSEHQTPARFEIASDPQTAHLPLDHPIRRRALLLSLAGAAALQACGGSGMEGAAAEDAPDAATPDAGPLASRAAAGATSVEPYAWTELMAQNTESTVPFPMLDGPILLSFNGYIWLIGGWSPANWRYGFPKDFTNAVVRSADGITWEIVKPDSYNTSSFNPATDWEGRSLTPMVVFKGRMWIIGGVYLRVPGTGYDALNDIQGPPVQVFEKPQNDIWSSADGLSWRKEGDLPFKVTGVPDNAANPTIRVFSGGVVFNNQIWLLGGQRSTHGVPGPETQALNEIWKSADGRKWTKVQVNGPHWTPRCLLGHAVVHGSRLWVLGGFTYEPMRQANSGESAFQLFNDVWSTADGVNWVQHLPNLAGDPARWGGRFFGSAASCDGKLWMIAGVGPGMVGGTVYDHSNLGDSWHSADGVSWTRLAQEIPPRHAQGVVVHGNTLRVVAGGGYNWNDSWMLSPYVWEKVPQRAVPHFGAGDGRGVVSNNSTTSPKMWVLGGTSVSQVLPNEVWSSPDATNWTLVKANTYGKPGFNPAKDWKGRWMQSAVFFNKRIWIVGGVSGVDPGHLQDVWSSADGKTWTPVANGVACLNRVLHTVTVFQNKLWIIGGQNNMEGLVMNPPVPTVYYNDVWNSSDGKTWTQVTAAAPWQGRGYIYGSVVLNDRLWVIGGTRCGGQVFSDTSIGC